MMGTADALDYRVAETIGAPLVAVRALPNAELVEWAAYFRVRDALDDLAERTAAERAS